MIETMRGWVTPSAAAKLLDRTPQRVRQLVASGRLEAMRTPLGHLVRRSSVERLLQERRRASA